MNEIIHHKHMFCNNRIVILIYWNYFLCFTQIDTPFKSFFSLWLLKLLNFLTCFLCFFVFQNLLTSLRKIKSLPINILSRKTPTLIRNCIIVHTLSNFLKIYCKNEVTLYTLISSHTCQPTSKLSERSPVHKKVLENPVRL